MPSRYDRYTSPLAERNASAEMLRLWSARHKFNTWRRIWLAIAEAQHEVSKDWGQPGPNAGKGAPLVTAEQVAELRAVVERKNADGSVGITDAEIERASELERELRHDVMSHVHCLGEQCPKARPIIHLGCTSQDIVCNADLLILRSALRTVGLKSDRATCSLADFAARHVASPTLGFTHYQSAQPLTIGRRAIQWAYELLIARGELRDDAAEIINAGRGLKGATGTQASFLTLFNSDGACVDELESRFMKRLFDSETDWHDMYQLTGQTYPRVHDCFALSRLASVAAVLHKIATDIRLLCNRKELDEPFEEKQIGSSAMPYKRNPMRCERICGLTRFVMNLVGNAYDTAATQWLERTLDDSSNRRLSLPEAFLALDGALDLMHNVASGLVVHEAMVRKNLMAELPFLATENIMMEAVRAGGDRQDLHEVIRTHAQHVAWRIKQEGAENDLIERLKGDPAFRSTSEGGRLNTPLNWDDLMDPMRYIGRSIEQTERFIADVIEPLRERYGDKLDTVGSSEPRV